MIFNVVYLLGIEYFYFIEIQMLFDLVDCYVNENCDGCGYKDVLVGFIQINMFFENLI